MIVYQNRWQHGLLLTCLFYLSQIHGTLIDPIPVAIIINPCPHYTLVNSVDFHPKKNLFCVTYSQEDSVAIYKLTDGKPELIQILGNPLAKLSAPQHAVFSPDGQKIVVANWLTQTFTVYEWETDDNYCSTASVVIPFPKHFKSYRPHGIAFSPCGEYLAMACGVSTNYGRAIAIFRMQNGGLDFELVSLLNDKQLTGIPKGITFSPDGTCLLVTFSNVNSLVIYDFDRVTSTILPAPRQIIKGQKTGISRPEDIKISHDNNYCAISNSDKHTVTIYPFDKASNLVTESTPSYVLKNPEADLCTPHGISFSPDGAYVLITQLGPITTQPNGDVVWDKRKILPGQARVNLYKIKDSRSSE